MITDLHNLPEFGKTPQPASIPPPPLGRQEGGSHYATLAIQPVEFITANKLSFLEGCIIKRLCRHRVKGKAEDIRKAIHELELILDLEYAESSPLERHPLCPD